MYGAQTIKDEIDDVLEFENDVEMYGAQTIFNSCNKRIVFENDVEMYGAQTSTSAIPLNAGLRMMQKCMVLKLNSSEA